MFKQLTLRTKIMIPMALLLILSGFTLTIANFYTMQSIIQEAEQSELNNYMNAFNQRINRESHVAESLSALVANLPIVQEKLAQNQRQPLIDLFSPGYKELAKEYEIDQFQFHTPPAISFLRIHKIEKYGDDLSGFRQSVVDVNKTERPVRGLERGVAGLGIRGVVPVHYQQRHIGSVEFGMDFGQSFIDKFKQDNHVEANLYVSDKHGFILLAGTMKETQLITSEQLQHALEGKNEHIQKMVANTSYALLAKPVMDYSGKAIAIVVLAMDNSRYQNALSYALNKAVVIAIIVLLLGLLVSWYISQYITKRIRFLMQSVNRIAEGDLTYIIQDDSKDELGELTNAINSMRAQLHNLASDVSIHAHSVYKAAIEITQAVEGQAATSSQTSASVAQITSTMEELSASSTQIAEHSKSVVEVANQAMSDSYKGSEAMQQVLARMQDIRSDNEVNLHEIIELGNKSKQISKIMTLINAVADQTKLIAFNAALEASSAGEAGKRFSVVASEIRRLADSVTESTNEIESKIGEIQDAINRLVLTSEKGSNGILAGTTASNQTAAHFNDIVNAVNQTSTAAQQISLSTQQQKTASSQVVVALREIVGASAHTATSINRIAQVSHEMLELAEHLSQTSESFKLEQ